MYVCLLKKGRKKKVKLANSIISCFLPNKFIWFVQLYRNNSRFLGITSSIHSPGRWCMFGTWRGWRQWKQKRGEQTNEKVSCRDRPGGGNGASSRRKMRAVVFPFRESAFLESGTRSSATRSGLLGGVRRERFTQSSQTKRLILFSFLFQEIIRAANDQTHVVYQMQMQNFQTFSRPAFRKN